MSLAVMAPNVWLFWMMLIAGAGLTLAGFLRSYDRFWHWRQARALFADEMAPAADLLTTGQEIRLRPHGSEDAVDSELALSGQVTHSGKRTLILKTGTAAAFPNWITLGATVTAEFTGDNARYRFESQVQDMRAADGIQTLSLSMPRWLERAQRRNHFRVALALPATFECADGYLPVRGASAASPPQHGTLVNLSVGGLCADLLGGASPVRAAQMLEQFAPDSILRVRLPIGALGSQSLLVRVRTCERIVVHGGLGVRISCVFLTLSTWEQELVAQKVFEAHREQLRCFADPEIIETSVRGRTYELGLSVSAIGECPWSSTPSLSMNCGRAFFAANPC